ncbi:hypothetical protein MKJ04_15020 [Pontibacter sp. E15-1]|uniref:hypothetical protein n=1 Tax=Pontibacter sp. E15-1 TaxID=2919918 RepID=UPI001F4F6FCB|nr:hypothetical protein [Pontibacter sp. E15-1]MCJ8166157.1 hypothetical protein [Pontibacter sp. E15-1]
MKHLLKPYLAAFMMGSLLFASTSCGSDDPKPIVVEQELITTVKLSLVPEGKGQNVTATFSDPDGDGGNAPTIETLVLAPNTTYNMTVTLSDDSKSPSKDITAEVRTEGDEHELFFTATGGLNISSVQKTDLDKNNRPVGLEATIVTGATSSGKLRVTLKHQPNLKGNTSDISKGETDVEADFPAVIQ